MKKLAYLLVLVLFASMTFAQNTDLRVSGLKSSLDFTLNPNPVVGSPATFAYAYVTTTVTDSDSIWYKTIGVDNKIDNLKAYTMVNVDRLTGTVTGVLYLQGKTFWDETAWTDIASSTISTSSDTKVSLTSTTAQPYRFYRVYYKGSAGTYTFKPSVFEFNIAK